jgi:hypothetical protein
MLQVTDDEEIVGFWTELIAKGHPDIKEGWVELRDIASLRDILTTIAFNGSVHHTAVNFGKPPAEHCHFAKYISTPYPRPKTQDPRPIIKEQ